MHVDNTGQLFAATLQGYGVRHVFQVPTFFLAALAELENRGIKLVTVHHEAAAAYMADGCARAGNIPTLCAAQQVGAANMAAGLREAWLAGAPVIAVTGGPHPDSRYLGDYQMTDDLPMFEPVTKFNARIEKPSRLADLLRQSFREATTGRPGPVHLEFPGRTADGLDGHGEFEVIVEPRYGRIPPFRPEPDSIVLSEVATRLERAERPVIVAGGGVVTSGAELELVHLAEKLQIPVATSLTGKGVLPGTNSLALGVVGSYGCPATNRIVQGADLVFFVGSRAGDMTTDHYTTPRRGVTVIQADINPAELGRVYPASLGLVGDAKVILRRLGELAKTRTGASSWVIEAQQEINRWREEVTPLVTSAARPIRPERLGREISDWLPDDGVVVTDTGNAAIWSANYIEFRTASQRFIRCMGTLGWAFPGSLGVKSAWPDRPVICFTGDGGFYYHMAEMETAARYGINTIVVVNNNSALGMVRKTVGNALGQNGDERLRDTWQSRPVDFAAIARQMGCVGIRVESPAQIRPTLEEALAASRPVVIDVLTDIDAVLSPTSTQC